MKKLMMMMIEGDNINIMLDDDDDMIGPIFCLNDCFRIVYN